MTLGLGSESSWSPIAAVGFVPPPYPVRPARALERLADSAARAVSSTARSARRAIPVPDGRGAGRRRRARTARWATRRRPAVAGAARGRGGVDRPALRRRASTPRTSARASAPRSSSPRCRTCCACATRSATPCCIRRSSYPTYEMGAMLAGCRAVPGAARRRLAPRPRRDRRGRRRARARAVGERARQPDVVGRRRDEHFATVAAWARDARHRRRERRVLRRVRARARDDPRAAALDGVLAVHSLSKRSNLAGMRVGFYAGDPELVDVSRRDPQARRAHGADADAGRRGRRARRRRPRRRAARALRRTARARARRAARRSGSCTTAGRASSTSGCASDDGADDGWEIAAQLAHAAGLLVAPGDLYGPAGADHVRLALVQPTDRFELAFDRLAHAAS